MIDRFGQTADGRTVGAVTLRGDGLTVRLLTLGSVLQSLRLDGVAHDLTRGPGSVAEMETARPYHGAIVGPVANRIAGAEAVIDGHLHRFPANEGGNLLHGGRTGTHARNWTVADAGDDHARLTLDLPDGEGGFPGNRQIVADWQVRALTLRLTLTATTDAPTLMNLANHSYWNLDGTDTWAGHSLRIAADRWLPVDAALLPDTPEMVDGTPMDFRAGRVPTPGAPPIDHNFCLADAPRDLTEVVWLTGASGVQMVIATTAPGVQVYDGRPWHEALAIEPQLWPDAPRHPDYPSILLRPGEVWQQVTEWRFSGPASG